MSEPLAERPLPPSPPLPLPLPPPRRSGWAGPILGGMIAAGLGFGAAQMMPVAASSVVMGASAEEVAALSAEVADLRAQTAAAPAPDLDGVTGRIDALEAQISAMKQPDMTGFEARIAALEVRPQGSLSGADAAALAALQTDVAAMKSGGISQVQVDAAGAALQVKLDAAMQAVDAMQQSAAAAATKSAQGAAILQIHAAMDSGAAYGAALQALQGITLPEALTANAEGLPSLKVLQDSYPQAARLALEAALKADMGESWTERALSFLRTQVGARSLTAREGTDPDAVLSRAEAALSAGDVPGALTELDALPDTAKTAMETWRTGADRRQAAQAGLAALTQELGL